jgi:uncharacterized membrane protein YfcA
LTLDPIVLATLVVAAALAALVNGVIGFGFALLAVIVFAILLGPKEAVILMSLLTPLMAGSQLIRYRRFKPTWRRFRPLLAGAIAGSIVGTPLLVVLPGPIIAVALGLFTIYYVATSIRTDRAPLAGSTERRLAPLAGFVGGVTNSTIGASGPVFGAYLVALGLRGSEFAFAISLSFFTMSLLRLSILGLLGQYSVPVAAAALVLFVPSVAFQRVGFWLHDRAPTRLLHRLVLVVLLVASVNLLWRGLSALIA